ncbi:MAG: TVP38/TMEM64 family protein [Phycisphaerae bacterium]|nr:TVP38/TMEM64 family protein [Phycisphaerae bacterium]
MSTPKTEHTPESPHDANPPKPRTDTSQRFSTLFRRLGPAGPLAVVSATLPALGGLVLLGMLTSIEPHLKAYREVGLVLYVLGFALLAGLAILPTYAQSVLGGWVYKFPLGFPAALGGVLGGALIGYGVGLRAAGDRVLRLIDEQPKWKAVYEALLGSGFWKTLLIITLVRLNSPFALTNFVLAATRANPFAYVLGTVLGLSPRTAAAVFIAAGLKELTFERGGHKWLWITGIVVTLIVIVIIGQIANNAVAKVTAADSQAGCRSQTKI